MPHRLKVIDSRSNIGTQICVCGRRAHEINCFDAWFTLCLRYMGHLHWVCVWFGEDHKNAASHMCALPYYYLAHMANSCAIVSSHVPCMVNIQDNRIAFIST